MFASSTLLNDLNQTRFQLLDGGDVAGQDSHFARFGWYIDLHAVPKDPVTNNENMS